MWRVEKSPIHGMGVFAVQDIPKGVVIAQLDKTRVFQAKIAEAISVGDGFLFDPLLYWTNHSCSPNIQIDVGEMRVRTVKEIAIGEELTYDYGTEGERVPCACGASECRGFFGKRS